MKTRILNYAGCIVLFLAAVITFPSCQKQNDLIDDDDQEQISLSPEVETRGAVVTTANMSEFSSFGYAQGHNNWAEVSTTATPNLMFNNKYTKTGNSWVGATKTQWPDNEFKRYSFFAYSPAGSSENKISVVTNSSTPGYQRLSYETLTDVSKQVDLVLATRLNQTPAKEVPLSFGHALSRVGFCAYAQNSGITVKSIAINGVKYKGQIEVRRDGDWSNVSTDKANFTAAIASAEISTDVNNPTMLTGSNGANYFMLLPQDLTGNADNAISITIVTTKGGKDRSRSYTITQNYQKGKSILYKLFIPDGVDLVVDYTVTDWTTTNIPTDIKATYLNVSLLSEVIPVTFFYATDYTGSVTATEVGTTGKLTITPDAAKKSFTVNGSTGGNYKVQVTAGNLSRIVNIARSISVTPTLANLSYVRNKYAVKVSSASPWSTTANLSDIIVTPSSGEAGIDIPVEITVGPNPYQGLRNIVVSFSSTIGTNSTTVNWIGTQIANPDYYVGRFTGTIVTQTIDANTTRYYYSNQVFVAPADESGTYYWAMNNGATSATSFRDGKSNTAYINANSYPAAYKCVTKTGGTWYLPAKDQLIQLYIIKSAIPIGTSGYWSSTENDPNAAYMINVANGATIGIGVLGKTNTALTVRCMREE